MSESTPEARLHLLLHPGQDALEACLRQLTDQDALLLADRGVELLAEPGRLDQLLAAAGSAYALQACCLARGLHVPAPLTGVDDAGWPALVRAHRHILSWP
jgi:sulfur relay protein TusB/DsrH